MEKDALKIGYVFENKELFNIAMTHSSLTSSSSGLQSNERLEFLGDRILGLVVAEILYKKYPLDAEGKLAKRHSELVSSKALTVVAEKIQLHKFINISSELSRSKAGFGKPLANSVEALIGAIYLDSDFSVVKKVVEKLWLDMIDEQVDVPTDYKTHLQEVSQSVYKILPVYKVLGQTGEDHKPMFEVKVSLSDEIFAIGIGKNKKIAEMDAAKNLLQLIKK